MSHATLEREKVSHYFVEFLRGAPPQVARGAAQRALAPLPLGTGRGVRAALFVERERVVRRRDPCESVQAQHEHALRLSARGSGAASSATRRKFDAAGAGAGASSSSSSSSARGASVGESWRTIDEDLSFLTNGAERRALDSLETRRPGERVLTLEDAQLLEDDALEMDRRDEDVEAIATSVTEVAQIFKELAVLVIDQGTILDRIDYNMENVTERTRTATTQLLHANKSSASAKPVKVVVALLIVISLQIILLFRKFT